MLKNVAVVDRVNEETERHIKRNEKQKRSRYKTKQIAKIQAKITISKCN